MGNSVCLSLYIGPTTCVRFALQCNCIQLVSGKVHFLLLSKCLSIPGRGHATPHRGRYVNGTKNAACVPISSSAMAHWSCMRFQCGWVGRAVKLTPTRGGCLSIFCLAVIHVSYQTCSHGMLMDCNITNHEKGYFVMVVVLCVACGAASPGLHR